MLLAESFRAAHSREVSPMEYLLAVANICTVLGFLLEVVLLVIRFRRRIRKKKNR